MNARTDIGRAKKSKKAANSCLRLRFGNAILERLSANVKIFLNLFAIFLLRPGPPSGKLGRLFPPNERRPMAQPLRRSPSRPMARPRRRRRSVLRRVLLALTALIVLLALVLVAGGIWVYDQMRGSLPRLDGERRLAGLAAPVEVERDDLGGRRTHAAN